MVKNVWTHDNVVVSPYKDIEIPDLTIDQYVWRNLDQWATKTSMVCGITDRSYTFEQVYKLSRTFAANLRNKFIIKDNDTVMVMLPNLPEFPMIVYGILAAGGRASLFNPLYTPYEIEKLLKICEASLIITIGDFVPKIKQVLDISKRDTPIILLDIDQPIPDGVISYKKLAEDDNTDLSILNEVKRSPDDGILLLFSSGTTGLPKAVQLTNRNFVAICQLLNSECKQHTDTTETHQDRVLLLLPLFHGYAFLLMAHKLSVGVKIVTLPKFQPETFLNSILKHKIQFLYLVPPLVMFLGTSPLVTPQHFKHLTFVFCGGAPLSLKDVEKFLKRVECEIEFIQGYGMTEALIVSTFPLGKKCYDKVGYPVPNVQLRIIDSEMRNLGPGESGELLVRGPVVMKGYYKNPQANKDAFVDGNWLRTGDIATVDETGLMTITDRLKELIKVKGYQVPPAELESILKEHPSVLDAAVVGVPDPVAGERPKGFIIMNQDAKTDLEDIIRFVNERVASYKQIKDIIITDSIPKNPTGKILRKVLRQKC